MKLWVTMSDVNLGKLVHLEVHDRLRNVKIAKKYFLMLEWASPIPLESQREELSNKLMNTQIGHLVREIQPGKSRD